MLRTLIVLVSAVSLISFSSTNAQAQSKNQPNVIGDFSLDDDEVDPAPNGGDPNSKLTGEIRVEEEEEQADPYFANQRAALAFFKNFEKLLADAAAGKTASAGDLDQGANLHLTGVYLYCLIAKGTCPELLDAVLEIDIVNSRLAKKAQCPNMTRFWKSWAGNGLDKKHGFQIQTGHLKKWEYFKANLLSRYLRCSETVNQEIALGAIPADAVFFKERYGQSSLPKDAVLQTIKLLESIKAKVANVFHTTKASK